MALALQGVEETVREHGTRADTGIVTTLALVERAAADVEKWTRDLGCPHVTRTWLEACAEWMTGVASALACAFAYEGAQRRVALELAAEESSMRLLMGVEREGAETVAILRNLDGGAARAATELAARIDLADRMLHAASTPPASARRSAG